MNGKILELIDIELSSVSLKIDTNFDNICKLKSNFELYQVNTNSQLQSMQSLLHTLKQQIDRLPIIDDSWCSDLQVIKSCVESLEDQISQQIVINSVVANKFDAVELLLRVGHHGRGSEEDRDEN